MTQAAHVVTLEATEEQARAITYPYGFASLEQRDLATSGITVHRMVVIPEVAAAWLTNNHQHRRISKTKVAEYRKMMSSDGWKLNGKTIVFDFNGKLVGGQHRLSACVASKEAFETLVVCGVDPSVVEIEQPKARKPRGKK